MKKVFFIAIILSSCSFLFGQINVNSSNNVAIGDNSDPGTYRLWAQNVNCKLVFGANSNGTGCNLLRLFNNVGCGLSVNSYTNLSNFLITDLGINYSIDGNNGINRYVNIGAKKAPVIRLNAENGSISLFGESSTSTTDNHLATNSLGIYVSSNGYVGVGNSNPQGALDVTGKIYLNGVLALGSDSTLKEDITTLSSSIKSVSNLRPVRYKLKQPNANVISHQSLKSSDSSQVSVINQPIDTAVYNRYHMGFIAQDFQKVFPELTYVNKNGVMSIDYIGMIPVLTKALNEQQTTIERQDSIINSQANDIALIKAQLIAIKNQLNK